MADIEPETAKLTPEEIAVIGEKYFGGLPLRAIQAAHNMTDYELRRLRKEQGWAPRRRRVTIQGLVKRLIELIDGQVAALEGLRSSENQLDEKRADIIGKTAATLQRLMAMDATFQRKAKPKPKGMTETQVRLAQRFEELRRR